ncbi:hypothetical protein ONS95_002255 [Cadophora gregata]|uniref:uncharacterized protein n=1 Tax=Cadophora gregata TaxID=51156 RepID=UPI0026DB1F1C|nr:uncharacterized protein ONS95_002255 [Cadophora gregata]KAK0109569.1 hypothetical protein ONS95_002255 [Cadophora gregata]KAK0110802.1 hypothetical protein ONS96_002395 [Cadophora gregata f. sp. sojae]
MDSHSERPSFKGEFMLPSGPLSQSIDRLCERALMALPFVGMFVGVDELVPIKAIYAIYDPSNCGIAYVRGDGTFAVASRICFTKQFKDSCIPLFRSQRTYLPELMARSALYYRQVNSKEVFPAQILVKFPTQSSVKASLTYIGDLVMDSCPALSNFDATPKGPDLAPPHVVLEDKPTWDFNTAGFQAITAPGDDIVDSKYIDFKRQYPTVRINSVDFQHAAFCLAGLLKQGMISFLHEGQNDRRFFVGNQTPVKHPAFVTPLRTARGWTVDCFLARFERFQDIYTTETYAQIPNPVNWLEAEMANEARLERWNVPWSIESDKKDDSVVSWELLKVMPFRTRGDSKEYPKSLIPKAPRPLRLNDIVTKSGKLRKSKYAKKERKERQRADQAAGRGSYAPVDLAEEAGFIPGHMVSSPKAIRGRDRLNHNTGYQVGQASHINRPEIKAPVAGQKRKHNNGQGSFQNPAVLSDSDEPEEIQEKPVEHNHNVEVEIEDVGSDSSSGKHRKKKSRRKSQSRKTKTFVPGADVLFASPGRTLRDVEELGIRMGSAASSPQEILQSFRRGCDTSRAHPKFQLDVPESDGDHETYRIGKERNGSRKSAQQFDIGRGSSTVLKRPGSYYRQAEHGQDATHVNYEEPHSTSSSNKRVSLGSPFVTSCSEPESRSDSSFDFSNDEVSVYGTTSGPQVPKYPHELTNKFENRSPKFTRPAATRVDDNDFSPIDLDSIRSTPTSASTYASDIENFPISTSRQPTVSLETKISSPIVPDIMLSTTKSGKLSNPHTPSPQTGDRFYDHIDRAPTTDRLGSCHSKRQERTQ